MTLREKILNREPLRGPFVALPTPMAVEITGGAQPDFLCIDTEHSPIGAALLTDMIRAADVIGLPVLVRVNSAEASVIAAALDAGAQGILMPHVSTVETAVKIVRAARFPPEGARGAGPARAAQYMRDIGGSIDRARRDTVVAIQIETVAAVEAAEEILAVPGLDLAFIGPGDLGVDLAARPERSETLDQLIDQVLMAADRNAIAAGIFTANREESIRWLSRLAFVIEGSDALHLSLATDAAFAPL